MVRLYALLTALLVAAPLVQAADSKSDAKTKEDKAKDDKAKTDEEEDEVPADKKIQAGALPAVIGDSAEEGAPKPRRGAVPAPSRGYAKDAVYLHSGGTWDSPFLAGELEAWAGDKAPEGWFECNGGAVPREQFKKLFEAVGTRWGAGDGSTTFNLPDLRSRLLRGWNHGGEGDSSATERIAIQAGGVAGDEVGSGQKGGTHLPLITAELTESAFSVPTFTIPGMPTYASVTVQAPLICAQVRTFTSQFNTNATDLFPPGCTFLVDCTANILANPVRKVTLAGSATSPGCDSKVDALQVSANGAPTGVETKHTHTATVVAADADKETRPANASVMWIIKY